MTMLIVSGSTAVYLIDKALLIHHIYVNPNYKIRLNEKVLLEAAKTL